ncbi:hypothetical protein AB1Y20_015187 [Prymnesium parvum]|uniref:APOBEC-like N-terminal domain-containing protein n=1 Tax=Prymnesium parvum TaxID=97485 RepID=A0AB34JZE0_PRYPA
MSRPAPAGQAYVPPHLRGRPAAPPPPHSSCGCAPSARVLSTPPPPPQACRCSPNSGVFAAAHAQPLRAAEPLLGGVAQFCAAFYHIEPTAEAGLAELCLARRQGLGACARKSVACVARLQRRAEGGAWEDVYTCRYSNCFRGGSRSNVHSEAFLAEDGAMERAVRGLAARGGRLVLYLTYQPCHHSGGHSSGTMGRTTSCTRLLMRYAERLLAPHDVSLHVRVPYIYRAHWQPGLFPPKYEPVVASAVEGLQLLASTKGIEISAVDDDDWAYLAQLCAPEVRSTFTTAAGRGALDEKATGIPAALGPRERSLFTPEVCRQRAKLDAFVATTLRRICYPSNGDDPAADASEAAACPPRTAAHEVPAGGLSSTCRSIKDSSPQLDPRASDFLAVECDAAQDEVQPAEEEPAGTLPEVQINGESLDEMSIASPATGQAVS